MRIVREAVRTLLPVAAVCLLVADRSVLDRSASTVTVASLTTQEAAAAQTSVLPSWNDGTARRAIVEFVERVTREGGSEFVPAPERIATFDNDGTLWSEKPLPVQLLFALDRVKALAPQHPEWRTKEPFASLLQGSMAGVAAAGEKGVLEIIAATHTGVTTDEFTRAVHEWITTARHPQTKRLYTEMVYQPMLELLAYLRANGFKTFIVSGGGVEFMRPWTLFVHHDDAGREFAYDREDTLQKFSVGWDEAVAKKWTVVSMRADWKTVFPATKN